MRFTYRLLVTAVPVNTEVISYFQQAVEKPKQFYLQFKPVEVKKKFEILYKYMQ